MSSVNWATLCTMQRRRWRGLDLSALERDKATKCKGSSSMLRLSDKQAGLWQQALCLLGTSLYGQVLAHSLQVAE